MEMEVWELSSLNKLEQCDLLAMDKASWTEPLSTDPTPHFIPEHLRTSSDLNLITGARKNPV